MIKRLKLNKAQLSKLSKNHKISINKSNRLALII